MDCHHGTHFGKPRPKPTLSPGECELCWEDGGLASELQRGMETMRLSGQLTDVTLSVQGEDFPCHRAVLAAASNYFRYTTCASIGYGKVWQLPCLGSRGNS